jgi:outer membrane biosynthesis protein TonB
MDRRGLRAIVVLVAAAVPALVLLAPRGHDGNPASAAGATDGPHSSMAGPTTPAAIGPTATPASRVWDEILAVPTPRLTDAPVASPSPAPNPKPKPRVGPNATPKPTPAPTPTPKPAPCSVFPSDNV